MKLTRRKVLQGAVAVSVAPYVFSANARSLRVSTFGGYFERMFAEHVHPVFTKATGIAVQSIEQSEGAQFLFQLAAANKAGKPPMDVCCTAGIDVLRGRAQSLWRHFDTARMPQAMALPPQFVSPDSFGAMSWYMTMVVNPEEVRALPDSWNVLWSKHPDSWGVMTGSQSPIFEITAALYFGGNDVLNHKEGVDSVVRKIAELKGNVKLWWQDEGTMQTALANEEVAGGTYMHDTAMIMARSGTAVKSIFPKEGAVESTNFWCQPSASTKTAEAEEFINFCSGQEGQELIARYVGSAPVLERSKLRLTEKELALVLSPGRPIPAATQARFQLEDYMEQQFTRMVTS